MERRQSSCRVPTHDAAIFFWLNLVLILRTGDRAFVFGNRASSTQGVRVLSPPPGVHGKFRRQKSTRANVNDNESEKAGPWHGSFLRDFFPDYILLSASPVKVVGCVHT